jgi:hypothetical protein
MSKLSIRIQDISTDANPSVITDFERKIREQALSQKHFWQRTDSPTPWPYRSSLARSRDRFVATIDFASQAEKELALGNCSVGRSDDDFFGVTVLHASPAAEIE